MSSEVVEVVTPDQIIAEAVDLQREAMEEQFAEDCDRYRETLQREIDIRTLAAGRSAAINQGIEALRWALDMFDEAVG